jgi:hypothetical protein
MKLRNIGSNQTVLEIGQGHNLVEILFSYDTPVAVNTGTEILVTEQKFSVTTSRHINQWVNGFAIRKVTQAEIEKFTL